MALGSGLSRSPLVVRSHADNVYHMLKNGAAAQSEIVASWDRCVRLYKLDPKNGGVDGVVSKVELRHAAERAESRLRSAAREIDSFARQMAKLGFFTSVADADGIVVDLHGRVPPSSALSAKMRIGMGWHEKMQGTNAIGTCLYTGHPIIVYQDDHFYESNSGMTCLGAPLFGPTGGACGALSTTTLDQSVGRSLLSALQALLVTVTQKIEVLWFRESFPKSMIIAAADAGRVTGSVPLLAVDQDLNVLGATRSARKHYGLASAALEKGIHLQQIDPNFLSERPSLYDAERSAIKQALAMADQNVSLAAEHLGISRATMTRKMAACGVLRSPRGATRRKRDVPAHL